MPRHLISDAHEWINKIPTVPIYYLAKPQPRERAWQNQRGKKTLLSLTPRVALGGGLWMTSGAVSGLGTPLMDGTVTLTPMPRKGRYMEYKGVLILSYCGFCLKWLLDGGSNSVIGRECCAWWTR